VSLPHTGQTWYGTNQGMRDCQRWYGVKRSHGGMGDRQQRRQRRVACEERRDRHGMVRDWVAGTLHAAMYRAGAGPRIGRAAEWLSDSSARTQECTPGLLAAAPLPEKKKSQRCS
jgi:hypothetical protein